MAEIPEQSQARNAKLFKAAWQKSIEMELKAELHKITKQTMDKLFQEMNKKALEVIANLQARLIMTGPDNFQDFNGKLTIQLLLPPEMQSNPPDGGQV